MGCKTLYCESFGCNIRLIWIYLIHWHTYLPSHCLHEIKTLMAEGPQDAFQPSLCLTPSLFSLGIWARDRIPDGEREPFGLTTSFWQKHHPSNQRGARNHKSLVIWTQRGQSLSKDRLRLLNVTSRKPPDKTKMVSPSRAGNKGPF